MGVVGKSLNVRGNYHADLGRKLGFSGLILLMGKMKKGRGLEFL